jgi:hypothetical protein
MALVGDLRQVSLPRLLTILSGGRKTGVLKVRSGKSTLTVRLRAGRLQWAWLSEWQEPTVTVISDYAPPEHRKAATLLAHGSDMGAALWLEYAGCVGADRVLAGLQAKGREALRVAATWSKGDLHYEDGLGLGPGELDLNLATAPLANRLTERI